MPARGRALRTPAQVPRHHGVGFSYLLEPSKHIAWVPVLSAHADFVVKIWPPISAASHLCSARRPAARHTIQAPPLRTGPLRKAKRATLAGSPNGSQCPHSSAAGSEAAPRADRAAGAIWAQHTVQAPSAEPGTRRVAAALGGRPLVPLRSTSAGRRNGPPHNIGCHRRQRPTSRDTCAKHASATSTSAAACPQVPAHQQALGAWQRRCHARSTRVAWPRGTALMVRRPRRPAPQHRTQHGGAARGARRSSGDAECRRLAEAPPPAPGAASMTARSARRAASCNAPRPQGRDRAEGLPEKHKYGVLSVDS